MKRLSMKHLNSDLLFTEPNIKKTIKIFPLFLQEHDMKNHSKQYFSSWIYIQPYLISGTGNWKHLENGSLELECVSHTNI